MFVLFFFSRFIRFPYIHSFFNLLGSHQIQDVISHLKHYISYMVKKSMVISCSITLTLRLYLLYIHDFACDLNVNKLYFYPRGRKWYNLTNFCPMFHFYNHWKRQKTFAFLAFSGGIEMEHWSKMVLSL